MRTLVIVNPVAGRGRAVQVWERLRPRLDAHAQGAELRVTGAAGEATEIARLALRAGVERIFVVGGDGTFNEVLNGYFEDGRALNPEAVLVPVRAGTGGDLQRSLGRTMAKPRRIDIGQISCRDEAGEPLVRYFANVASCGQSTAVATAMAGVPRWCSGGLAYLWAIFATLRGFRVPKVRLTVGARVYPPQRARCVAIANGRTFGGGLVIAPGARVDDGKLDLTILGDAPLRWLLRHAVAIHRGRHEALVYVHGQRAARIELAAGEALPIEADGQLIGRLPAIFEVRPAAVRVGLPEPVASR